MKKVLVVLLAAALVTSVQAVTVAQWDFEDGVAGQPFDPDGGGDSGSLSIEGNNYLMRGWDATYGPSFAAAGDGLSLYANGGQDGYTTDATFNAFGPEQWTIETSVKLDVFGGWETVIGKDGASHGQVESDFYLQKADATGNWRLDYHTQGGQKVIIDSGVTPAEGRWYGLAIVSDGVNTTFYIDSGSGYQMVGQEALTGATAADNALTSSGYSWTFARGWWNGGFGDHIEGNMDNVRFSDTALSVEELLPVVPEPATMVLLGLGGLLIRRKK